MPAQFRPPATATLVPARTTSPPCCTPSFFPAGSRLNIYDLLARPEFAGHYKRVHKGTVVVGLGYQQVPEIREAEVRCCHWVPPQHLSSF